MKGTENQKKVERDRELEKGWKETEHQKRVERNKELDKFWKGTENQKPNKKVQRTRERMEGDREPEKG